MGAAIERFVASLREPCAMGAVVVSGERTVAARAREPAGGDAVRVVPAP